MLRKIPDDGADEPEPSRSRANWITLFFAVLILTPSMIGFVMKFIEFVHTFRDDSAGAFAITPMVNYLLASLGFLCLLLWAAVNGMFHDMEEPKRIMLRHEMMLDENLEKSQGAIHGD
jgi:hypothetical protein